MADLTSFYTGIQRAISDAHDPAQPPAIKASSRMSAAERLAVYRDDYLVRLSSALSNTYAAIERLMGTHEFRALTDACVRAHPSRTFNIVRYGADFPGFIAAWDHPQAALLADVARALWAIDQAAEAPEAESMTPDDLVRIESPDAMTLKLIPSCEILHLRYNIDALLDNWYAGNHLEGGDYEPRPVTLMVYRGGNNEIWRRSLSAGEAWVLEHLQSGASLGDALESMGNEPALADVGPEDVAGWFSALMSEGVFLKPA